MTAKAFFEWREVFEDELQIQTKTKEKNNSNHSIQILKA